MMGFACSVLVDASVERVQALCKLLPIVAQLQDGEVTIKEFCQGIMSHGLTASRKGSAKKQISSQYAIRALSSL